MVTLALPLLVIVDPPPVLAVSTPCETLTTACNPSVAPDTPVSVASLTVIRLLLPLLNTSVPSSCTVCDPGTVFTGASLTALTLNVIVLALWSRATPPLSVPPSSRTWNVKLA